MLDSSFAPYGEVERFSREQNRGVHSITVSGQTEVAMYCFDSATFWDYVEGMTILLIQDGEQLKRYYLDRAVTIHPGVCFGFYSLGPNSLVAGDTQLPNSHKIVDISKELPQREQVQVFTLFRQLGQDGLFFRGEQHPPLELAYVEKGVMQCGVE